MMKEECRAYKIIIERDSDKKLHEQQNEHCYWTNKLIQSTRIQTQETNRYDNSSKEEWLVELLK